MIQDVCSTIKIDEHVDYIIHAASQASPKYFGSDPVGTLSANTIGTANLLELARKHESEGFLFFSSGEVYGQVQENQLPIPEHVFGYLDPTDVRSCYAESKRMGETMCSSWSHQYGVPAKIVRPFHTYGPEMSLTDGRVFADFVSDVSSGKDIVLKSNGSASRTFCYLADAVSAFFTVLFNGRSGEAYNVGNPQEEISILDLASLLIGLYPKKKLKIIHSYQNKDKGYLKSPVQRSSPDLSKISTLGWQPTTSVKEGFSKTINYFEKRAK